MNRLTPGEAFAALSTFRTYTAGLYAWFRRLNTELLAPRRSTPS